MNLTCAFYAEDLNQAAKLRSDCYFQIMDALQRHEIAFAGVRLTRRFVTGEAGNLASTPMV